MELWCRTVALLSIVSCTVATIFLISQVSQVFLVDVSPGDEPLPEGPFMEPNSSLLILTEADLLFHGNQPQPDIFLGILSSPRNAAQRKYLRETWLTLIPNLGEGRLQYKFFVGQSTVEASNRKVDEENSVHGDIVRVNRLEHYRWVSNKTLALFEYATTVVRPKAILKTDDDIFVNLPVVVDLVMAKLHDFLYMGRLWIRTGIARDPASKYHVTWEEFPETVYPNYACGNLYAIGPGLARWIVDHRLDLRPFWIDDVSVGLWVKEAIADGIKPRWVDNTDFCQFCIEGALGAHYFAISNFPCMWQRYQAGEPNFCC